MLAEISIFPLDKGHTGLSNYVAGAVKIIKESGLNYELHAFGTLVEGPADKIFELIRKLYDDMYPKSERFILDCKMDERKGATQALTNKVKSVLEKLRD
jgi:uncharacterized protein (TIGR00106 family)